MQWYCAKKYKPARTLTDVLVRTIGGGLNIAYNCEMADGSYCWHETNGEEDIIPDVTHFCIPDPINVQE